VGVIYRWIAILPGIMARACVDCLAQTPPAAHLEFEAARSKPVRRRRLIRPPARYRCSIVEFVRKDSRGDAVSVAVTAAPPARRVFQSVRVAMAGFVSRRLGDNGQGKRKRG
jgi:hypothetical protein